MMSGKKLVLRMHLETENEFTVGSYTVVMRWQAWQHRTCAARPAVLASASAESGPTLRKPELVSKPVVREAPPELDAVDKQHDAVEKPSSSTATAAPCAPRGASLDFERLAPYSIRADLVGKGSVYESVPTVAGYGGCKAGTRESPVLMTSCSV